MSDTALDLIELLKSLGFDSPVSQELARAALIEAKLTNAGKKRIDSAKKPRVEELLRSLFFVACGAPDCLRSAAGRTVLRTNDIRYCWACQGSPNRRASQSALDAMKRAGIQKLVIVGGSPSVHDELRELFGRSVELRLIDGTGRRTQDAARSDLKWADLTLLWGSSELDHKVSTLYSTNRSVARGSVLHVTRRGIAALLDAVVLHVEKGR